MEFNPKKMRCFSTRTSCGFFLFKIIFTFDLKKASHVPCFLKVFMDPQRKLRVFCKYSVILNIWLWRVWGLCYVFNFS